MNECPIGGFEPPSNRSAGEFRYALMMLPGFIGSFLACNLYPPIIGDSRFRSTWLMCLFALAAFGPRLWNIVKRRPIDDTTRPAAYVFASFVYALVAMMLFLNGALDRVPPTEVNADVIRKAMMMGTRKSGPHYHVIVSSWRPGKVEEDFDVDANTYHRTEVGKIVVVELHKGFLGVPWSGNISPR